MENMVEPYVEALKFLTPLSFDVLTFGLIARLADPSRKKLKDDGYNTAEWCALSLFVLFNANLISRLTLEATRQNYRRTFGAEAVPKSASRVLAADERGR